MCRRAVTVRERCLTGASRICTTASIPDVYSAGSVELIVYSASRGITGRVRFGRVFFNGSEVLLDHRCAVLRAVALLREARDDAEITGTELAVQIMDLFADNGCASSS